MGSPPLAVACLLGTLVASCFGWPSVEDADLKVRLGGSSSPCQGQLQVYVQDSWSTLCAQSWGLGDGSAGDARQAAYLCQQLHCGDVCRLRTGPAFRASSAGLPLVTCHGALGSFSNCSSAPGRCQTLDLVCLEPRRTPPPPTSPPPPTTPAPTAPPRLWLVAGPAGSRGLQCAGTVEFYSGRLGGAVGYQAPSDEDDELQRLGTLLCSSLGCGSFLKRLPGAEASEPIRWTVRNASCSALPQCFQRAPSGAASPALALLCSGFQPKVQSRLVGGGSTCQGIVEVRQGGPGARWAALCYRPGSSARWDELCQEQQCGSFATFRKLDAGAGTHGFLCPGKQLSQCHELEERSPCQRVYVTCQDPHPPGPAAGTVGSIVLALVLLAVLLVVCGPPAYRKLMKKVRQKKQRQWIGPTGMSQNMSFHRNHSAAARPRAEDRPASHAENEYSQPPRNSRLSAYPALEGALRLSAAPPDNSSDSDYDLHAAQRL
ncbi:PREDICTED: T-cell surface glycoprotein CD5 isoform X2 [Chinchilla lanigera]|uniref:T-cell surface glycoprotein CD5 isoform X2 n=1 Tax=Chinchilla lanigera TaxID=34839 RepID=UPI00038EB14E|nr:PREDICTED: T-cell surface glycoprotein CD5 isoform X2 [Chinchilla lanigera]